MTLSLGGRVGDQEDTSHEAVFERVHVPLYCPVMLTNTYAGIKTAKENLPWTSFQFLSIFWPPLRWGGLLLSISAEMCPKLDLARQGASM